MAQAARESKRIGLRLVTGERQLARPLQFQSLLPPGLKGAADSTGRNRETKGMVQSRKPLAALLVVFGTVLLILFGAALLAHYRRSSNSLAQPAGSANSSVANTDNSSAANADNSPTVNGNNPPANGGSYSPAEQPPPTVTIPAGTEIVVRLEDSLSSSRNRRGDSFVASLAEPLIIDNYIVAPEDSKLTGRVVAARESGHLKTPADLAITLTSLEWATRAIRLKPPIMAGARKAMPSTMPSGSPDWQAAERSWAPWSAMARARRSVRVSAEARVPPPLTPPARRTYISQPKCGCAFGWNSQ